MRRRGADSSWCAIDRNEDAGSSQTFRATFFKVVISDVYRLHTTSDRTQAHLLRGALESAGVPAFVEGEHLTPLQGQIPTGASAEFHVSIVDEEQLPRASIVARSWFEAQSHENPSETWKCGDCGETHEAQFHSCWQCGAERDAP